MSTFKFEETDNFEEYSTKLKEEVKVFAEAYKIYKDAYFSQLEDDVRIVNNLIITGIRCAHLVVQAVEEMGQHQIGQEGQELPIHPG